MILHSPASGAPLAPDTPHSLAAAGERWPVVDGIPYLRTGREALVAAVLALLDGGHADAALARLLADQDDWWTGPVADPADLARLVSERDGLSLRAAMALLQLGPVADYFAYRWSDPTYLAGLALLEAYWSAPSYAFELACGIGHYLRDLGHHGVACTGADVVFAKCWLAKHWVAPDAQYLVFDAASPWPIRGERHDLVMCHDAFYFLPDQPAIAAALRRQLAPGGMLAISHLHNAGHAPGAMGPARSAGEWAALFPRARVHDERDLLHALLSGGVPAAGAWADDASVEAWSLVEGGGLPRAVTGGLALPPPAAILRPNPLLNGHGHTHWPSDRYAREYGAGCFWAMPDAALPFASDPVRLRRVVDLPDRW